MDLFLCLQFPRSDAKSHAQTHIERHLDLALRALEATQHQVNELLTVVKDQSQQIERQSQQIERHSQDIEQQSQQIERHSQDIEQQSQQIEQHSQDIEQQSQQIERHSQDIERRSQQSKDKRQSKKMDTSKSTVQRQPPQTRRPGSISEIVPTPFEWVIPKIDSFLSRSTLGTQRLVSEQFYLFEYGYKYVMKIERSLHSLIVYIKVVPGEFDKSLSWPCKEKVRVTVIDQDPLMDNRYNISHVIDFEEDRKPFSRPLLHNDHQYRGILSVTGTDLQSRSFIENDTILIRVDRE